MAKRPSPHRLDIIMVLPAPSMFPLMQGHGMTEEMQERMRPKRKKKHGGKVPGLPSRARADRRRRSR
jgi:hypothetical protein